MKFIVMMPRKVVTIKKILVIMLFLLYESQCINELVLTKDNKSFYCITNTSHALTWISEEIEEDSELTSTFISNDFQHLTETNNTIFNPLNSFRFLKTSSISKEMILDRRWEEIPIHKTTGKEDDFKTLISNLPQNFTIPFSLRGEKNIHIFLCYDKNLSFTNCYWFQIYAYKGRKTAVHKCWNVNLRNITTIDIRYQEHNCTKNLNTIKYDVNRPKHLDESKWVHFQLEKQAKNYTLSQINQNSLIAFTDPEYLVTTLTVYSKKDIGLWKIHRLNYFSTTLELNQEEFGPVVDVLEESVCITMFVLMCHFCSLKISLKDAGNSSEFVAEMTHLHTKSWKEIKISVDCILHKQVKLLISTFRVNSEIKEDGFWAIGNIKQCRQNSTWRIIRSKKKSRCQLLILDEDNAAAVFKPLDTTVHTKLNCASSQDVICYVTNNSTSNKITIEASRVWTETSLTDRNNYFYAIDYKQIGHQWTPALINLPLQFQAVHTITNLLTDDNYYVRCRLQTSNASLFEDEGHLIRNRCLGLSQSKSQSTQIMSSTPKIRNITAGSTNARINFSSTNCTKTGFLIKLKLEVRCNTSWCNQMYQKQFSPKEETLLLNDLQPFTNYTLNITFFQIGKNTTVSTNFRTNATVPNPVRDLLVYSKNYSSISLRWMPPYPPTGKLYLYKISYFYFDKEQQVTINVTSSYCNLWPEYICFILTDLEKNQIYTIQIRAQNKEVPLFGNETSITVVTITEPSKPPYDFNLEWTLENDLQLRWKYLNETNGEIKYFTIFLKKTMIDLSTQAVIVPICQQCLNYNTTIKAKKIQPSTNYTVVISAYNYPFTSKEVKLATVSPPDIPDFEWQPQNFTDSNSITIEIPPVKNFVQNNTYKVFIIKSTSNEKLRNLTTTTITSLSDFGVLYECTLHNSQSLNVTIIKLNKIVSYNLTMVLTNTDRFSSSRYKIYSLVASLQSKPLRRINDGAFSFIVNTIIIIITVLGIVAIIIWNAYILFRHKKLTKNRRPFHEEIPLRNFVDLSIEDDVYTCSKPISVLEFSNYVKHVLQNKEVLEQHQKILDSAIKELYDFPKGNLFWDHVDLSISNSCINRKAYVVTEMPNIDLYLEFWKNIWKEDIKHVVLIDTYCNKHQEVTEKLWPTETQELNFDNIKVKVIGHKTFADYEQTTFQLTSGEKQKTIYQFQFLWLSENEIPKSSIALAVFIHEICKISITSKSPILFLSTMNMAVQGLVLLCIMCLRQAQETESVDVVKHAYTLAKCNLNLINNNMCYIVAHLIILDTLLSNTTRIYCRFFDPKLPILVSGVEIRTHFDKVNEMIWLDQTLKIINNKEDHKYTYIDSLNVVTVDGYRVPKKYIACRQPTIHSLEYFWKLVEEKNIKLIISLNFPSKEKNYWWPDEKQSELNLSADLIVKHQGTKNFKDYVWKTVHLEKNIVELFLFKSWSHKVNHPDNIKGFVSFCLELNKLSKHCGCESVMVTCNDGRKACGLYLALSYIIEKMVKEEVCDVCSAVRLLNYNYQEFIKNIEQFTFLWKASETYLKENQLYEQS